MILHIFLSPFNHINLKSINKIFYFLFFIHNDSCEPIKRKKNCKSYKNFPNTLKDAKIK